MNFLKHLIAILAMTSYCCGWISSSSVGLLHNEGKVVRSASFQHVLYYRGKRQSQLRMVQGYQMNKEDTCKDFTILVCRSTSCTKKRRLLGLDEFHTLGTLYSQQLPELVNVEIEESSCLGQCSFGPCVAVQHADYEGPVALEGMNAREFNARVFCR
jgi:NADH:ubiquinone oxidoreductase subunit E